MLSQLYPPIIGGEEQHVRNLSIELAARGHEVAVVTVATQEQEGLELDEGVRVYRICSSMRHLPWLFSDSGRQYAPPFPDPEVTLAIRRIIIQERPQIVHAHNWLVHSFLPLKVWSGARLVVTLHNYNLVCAKSTLMYQNALCSGPQLARCLHCAIEHYGTGKGIPTVLSGWVMSLAKRNTVDMFLPVSNAVAAGNGLVANKQPYQVVPNFIPDNVEMQGDATSYVAQLPAEGYLLFVGALGCAKGVDVLLHAYAHLTNVPPLVLIGYRTPDWSLLAHDCSNSVVVLEKWPHYAVMEALRRSTIALAPSVWPEPCSTVVMEAMSTGRPVIASRAGGTVDLVDDGETGYLTEPGDAADLQNAIEQLLANTHLRSSMSKAALRKVVDFQASTVIPRIEQIYAQVLNAG